MSRNIFCLKDFYNPDNKHYPVYSWMWNEILNKKDNSTKCTKDTSEEFVSFLFSIFSITIYVPTFSLKATLLPLKNAATPTVCGDWSSLYGEDFSGKCEYRAKFNYDAEEKALILSLGKVCYSCEISLNGTKIADLYMPPYETVIDKTLIKKENELIITLSNTAANAFVHFELPKEWEEKHIGPYHEKALEFEKNLLPGGLFGPVELYEKENSDE